MSFLKVDKYKTLLLISFVLIFVLGFPLQGYTMNRKITRTRKSRGGRGNSETTPTQLYTGEAPSKIGDDLHDINSKFYGFYDYKKDTQEKTDEQAD